MAPQVTAMGQVRAKTPGDGRPVTWDQILAGLDSALDFCRSLGLTADVASSRFQHHRDRVAGLVEQVHHGPPGAALELYNTDRLAHVVALSEAWEMALIDPFLRVPASHVVRRKLRDVLRGPVLPSDEDQNSNQARNILFELNFASKLWAVGVTPTLGDRPDLRCEVDEKPLLIECKRALSERGARSRLSDAWEALVTEAKNDRTGARGIAALSIGKVVANGGHHLTAPNTAAARRGLREGIASEADRLKESWEFRRGTRVIAIVFHVITPSYVTETKTLGTSESSVWYPLAPEGSRDWRVARGLCARLEANPD